MNFYWKDRFYKGGCNYTPPRGTSVKNNVGIRRVNLNIQRIGGVPVELARWLKTFNQKSAVENHDIAYSLKLGIFL